METHEFIIRPDGTVSFIYNDKYRELFEEASEVQTCRVSNVEPTEDGSWVADLSPIGPKSPPFRLRADALAWEVNWINTHYLK